MRNLRKYIFLFIQRRSPRNSTYSVKKAIAGLCQYYGIEYGLIFLAKIHTVRYLTDILNNKLCYSKQIIWLHPGSGHTVTVLKFYNNLWWIGPE
jgi:hypothetical protein